MWIKYFLGLLLIAFSLSGCGADGQETAQETAYVYEEAEDVPCEDCEDELSEEEEALLADAERAVQLEAEQLEAERVALEEAEQEAQLEAERLALEEAERLAQLEAERLALEEAQQAAANLAQLGLTEARVIRVIDGDTIVVDYHGIEERVRFIGLDAPEVGECGSEEATQFVRDKIAQAGNRVWLQSSHNDRDRFDRLRRYIWLDVPSDVSNTADRQAMLLNQMLLDEGHGKVMVLRGHTGTLTGPGEFPHECHVAAAVESPNTPGESSELTVYWTVNGSVWHRTRNCRGLRNANERNIRSGTVEESGKYRECQHSQRGG